jgi:folylpolyglutamate synthase/dihydropteroate synthase
VYSDTDCLNTDIAKAALKIIKESNILLSEKIDLENENLQKALLKRPICRFEEFDIVKKSDKSRTQVKVILDMAHNIAAIKALAQRVRSFYPSSKIRYNLILIYSFQLFCVL